MQTQIKFTAPGSSTACGNFAPGDVLRCSHELARHFVADARCARYDLGPAAPKKTDKPRSKQARSAS